MKILYNEDCVQIVLFDAGTPIKELSADGISLQKVGCDLSHPQYQAFGVSINGRWVYYVGIFNWKTLPYFTLMNLRKTSYQGQIDKATQILNKLFSIIFDHEHKNGRFTFYIVTRVKNLFLPYLYEEGRFPNDKTLPVFDDYEMYLEEFIEAGKMSEFSSFNSLLGVVNNSRNQWIRRCSLKLSVRGKRYPHSIGAE